MIAGGFARGCLGRITGGRRGTVSREFGVRPELCAARSFAGGCGALSLPVLAYPGAASNSANASKKAVLVLLMLPTSLRAIPAASFPVNRRGSRFPWLFTECCNAVHPGHMRGFETDSQAGRKRTSTVAQQVESSRAKLHSVVTGAGSARSNQFPFLLEAPFASRLKLG